MLNSPTRFLTFLTFITILSGCASGELPPRAAADPANPAAPETPPIALPSAPSSDAPAHTEHVHGAVDAGPTVYSCPMHPEVVQPTPGKCPKCGMELRPRSSS